MATEPGVWALLESLSACLCAAITESGRPVCFCGVIPGLSIVDEYGPEGAAWVRLGTVYPSTAFPGADGAAGRCGAPMAWNLEVGIIRCAPLPDGQGGAPSDEDQFMSALWQVQDMELMHKAIACCVGSEDDYEYALGTYTPYGPQGDRVGGTWNLVVRRV